MASNKFLVDIDVTGKIDVTGSGTFGGNVGIGTTNPSQKLTVAGNILAVSSTITAYAGSAQYAQLSSINLTINNGGGKVVINSNGDSYLNGGNVGIGTASPRGKLTIGGGGHIIGDDSFRIGTGGTGNTPETSIKFTENAQYFYVSNGIKMIVQADGNVGIGTDSPGAKLDVSEGYILSSGAGTSHGFQLSRDGLDTYQMRHLDGGLTIYNSTDSRKEMTFSGDGNVGIGTNSPNEQLSLKGNLSVALTGTISVTINTAIVTGVGTLFTTELNVGDSIKIGTEIFTVATITSALALTINSNHLAGVAAVVSYKDNDSLSIQNGDSVTNLIVDKSGNVGIGTTLPTTTLDVDGVITATGGDSTEWNSAYANQGNYLLNTTDTLTGDLTVTGGSTLNAVNVGTATGGVVGSQFTNKSTSTSTGTNVNSWTDVNRVHTAIASGDTYGEVVRVVSNSSSLDGGVVGSNQIGRQSGSGGAGFVYGNIVQGEQTGSGDSDFIIGSSVRAESKGSGSGTIDYVRGVSVEAKQDNSTNTVNFLQGAHISVNLTAGTVGEVAVNLLDFDYTAGSVTGDLAYLKIQNDDTSGVVGDARAIHSISTLPSLMLGDMETTGFIKTGGTSSQFLKADGSIDSTAYAATSHSHNDLYYTETESDAKYLLNTSDTLTGTLIIDGGTGVSSTGVFQVRQNGDTVSNGIAITSSNGASHRIWKDATGNLKLTNSSGAGAVIDLSGNITATNLSGTNTGDNAANSLYSGLVSNVSTNISVVENATTVSINSSDGTDDTIAGATASLAGVVTNTTQTFGGNKTFDDLVLFNTATDSGYQMTVGTKDSTGNLYSIYATGRIYSPGDIGSDTMTVQNDVEAGSFTKSGGTSSQFLMADGSTSTSIGGDFSAQISTLTNADTAFDKAGTYRYSNTTTNTPNDYGTILTTVDSGGDYNSSNNWLTQMAHGTDNVSYLRYKVNTGAFTSWRQLAFTDSYATTSVGGTVSTTTQSFAGNKTFTGTVTSNSFVKNGGTSSQFLKADGSVDTGDFLEDSTIEFQEIIALSDETTDLVAGTATVTFRAPDAITVSSFRLSCNTAPTGSTIIVDVNVSGTTMLSTKLSIDASEKTSQTAATPHVISSGVVGDDNEITIDIDQIGSTIAGKGLKLIMYYTRTFIA